MASGLDWRSAALHGALVMFLVVILVPIGRLVHSYVRTEVVENK